MISEVKEEVKEKQRCHDEAPNILFLAMVTCCHGGHKSINLYSWFCWSVLKYLSFFVSIVCVNFQNPG